jgi:hypothetical protein
MMHNSESTPLSASYRFGYYPEDIGSRFLRNVGTYLRSYNAQVSVIQNQRVNVFDIFSFRAVS